MISSLTTSDTALSCNPSSVNLGGDSSYVHLDDYIESNSRGVIPRVFPFMFRHTVTMNYYDFTLNHVTKDGSTLRGARTSIIASDEEPG